MDNYNIKSKDTQYGNLLYCMKYYKPSRFIFNDITKSVTIKDDIIYCLTDDLYNEISSKYKGTKMPNASNLK